VEWDLGSVEHQEQFALVGMEPCEQTVEGDKPGPAGEDAVEPCPQGGLAPADGMLAIGFEITIEPPDKCANFALCLALLIREGVELVTVRS
jgi:hypothetical protein